MNNKEIETRASGNYDKGWTGAPTGTGRGSMEPKGKGAGHIQKHSTHQITSNHIHQSNSQEHTNSKIKTKDNGKYNEPHTKGYKRGKDRERT